VIVVVESPCAPQPDAVAKLETLISTCGAHDEYIQSLTSDEFSHLWSETWGVTSKHDIRLRNTYYARAAMLDCLLRGEAPYLSHLLYTQVLDDDVAEERKLGIDAGIELSHRLLLDEDVAHVFYDELGISGGMRSAAKSMSPDADVRRIDFGRRKLGDAARAWYLARVPAAIAWLV
jgi:hypothetical protein